MLYHYSPDSLSVNSAQPHDYLYMVNKAGTVVGVLAIWAVYDQLPRGLGHKIWSWAHFTFFAYLLHEPLQTVLWKISRKVAPDFLHNPYFNLVWLVVLTVVVCFGVAQFLNGRGGWVYYYLAGGRVKAPNQVFLIKATRRSPRPNAARKTGEIVTESYQERIR